MKRYFLLIQSKDFPECALSKPFMKHNKALEKCLDYLWSLQSLFDFDCDVIHHFKRQGMFLYSIIGKDKRKIDLQVVRCDTEIDVQLLNE